jgi:hypothetical protein
MPSLHKDPFKVMDPDVTTAPGVGIISAAGRYYSKATVMDNKSLASWDLECLGDLVAQVTVEHSNATDQDVHRGLDRWLVALDGEGGAPIYSGELGPGEAFRGLFGFKTVQLPTDTADLTFRKFADGSPDHTVVAATAAALAACTAAGAGVGKTLTANANGVLTVDGVAVVNTDLILVKNQVMARDNGIYVVTDKGAAGAPFVLTRAGAFDESTETVTGATVSASGGVTQSGVWVLAPYMVGLRVKTPYKRVRLRFDVQSGTGWITARDMARVG